MALVIAVAGSKVQLAFTDGTIQDVTLPTGVSVVANTPARFAILGRNVVVTNAVTRPIWIDPDGIARLLTLSSPAIAPTVAAGAAGSLTGTFGAVKVTFAIKDSAGNILVESDYGPASGNVALTSDALALSAIPISGDVSCNCRRIYRPLVGPGAVYYHVVDLDDNTTTSLETDVVDAAVTNVPADPLGGAPSKIELVATWKNRVWAKNPNNPDETVFSEDGSIYQFPDENAFAIKPEGQDERGLTAYLARRDELGVGKRDMLAKIVGDSDEDFAVITVVVGVGPVSQESVVVIQDVAYFLGEEGVYKWDAQGVECVSDAKVRDWFTSDTYFARSEFENAVAHYDPQLNAYVLGLAAVGSTTVDRWVHYDLETKTWWGPHKTGLSVSFGSMALIENANDIALPVFGASDGRIYKKQATFTDGAATAIDFDVDTRFFSGDAPDVTHYWGMPTILSKILGSGTLTITPKVGRLNASAGTAISHTMTLGRERLPRLGIGALLQLNLRQATNAVGAQIYGIEIPWHEVGRR